MNEYLTFFTHDGHFDIEVNFLESVARIAKRYASVSDITRLLELLESNAQPCMTFDEYPGEITAISIDLTLNKLKLTVQL